MWFDLNHTATNAEGLRQGIAAFNLFLLYSLGRYGQFKNLNDALDLLHTAAKAQYGPAFVVGKRIFEATGLSDYIPDVFHHGPEDLELRQRITLLESLPNDEYYSSAVRTFWLPKLKADVLEILPKLPGDAAGHELIPLMSKVHGQNPDEFRAWAELHHLLHHSIVNGNYAACELFLQLKCNINTKMPGGVTPLHLACRLAESLIIRLLLSNGADATLNDDQNISPLHWLVLLPKSCVRQVAELLVAQCGDVKNKVASTKSRSPMFFDDVGLILEGTPLSWAIDCGDFTAIQAMLEFGFIPLLDKSWPQGYLHMAIGTANYKITECFLRLCDPLSPAARVQTFKSLGRRAPDFTRWLMHGNTHNKVYGEILDLLESFGIRLPLRSSDMANTSELTPLCTAVISYDVPVIKELLQRGASVNDRNALHTALGWAFASADATGPKHKVADVVKLLLDHDAVTEPRPPLHEACSFFVDPDVLCLLINKSAQSVNTLYHGVTPLLDLLSYDIKDDLYSKVQVLAASGADLNAESPHTGKEIECCYTALAYSLVNLEWATAELLLQANATIELGVGGGHRHTVLHLLIRYASRIQAQKNAAKWASLLYVLDNFLHHPVTKEKNLVNARDHAGISPLRMAIQLAIPAIVGRLTKSSYGIDHAEVKEEKRLLLRDWPRSVASGSKNDNKRMDSIIRILEEALRIKG